jgi:hypothetical protein
MDKPNVKKIMQAIAECDRFINLEGRRSDDLRPASVQKTLDFYKAHKAKLQGMLA